MNYRHDYHAGNFADLFKHAILLDMLADLGRQRGPLTVIDSHAGAGLYDLDSPTAQRTGEGEAARRLMRARDAPAIFRPLVAAIAQANTGPAVRYYPGSPVLVARGLGPKGRLHACEVRPEDAARLRAALGPSADVLTGDGWENAARLTPRAPGAALVLVDPPFEAPDDGERAARLARRVLARNAGARLAVWAPIKDLASFDTLVGAIEDAVGDHPLVVLECRLRPPNDPLRLNGCAMIVVHPSAGLQARAASAAAWLAGNFGDGAPRL